MSDIDNHLLTISDAARSIVEVVDSARELAESADEAINFLDRVTCSTGIECADEATEAIEFGREVMSGTSCDDWNEIVVGYNDYNELLRDLEVCDISDVRDLAEYMEVARKHGCDDTDDVEERLSFASEVISIFGEYGEDSAFDADGVKDALHRLTTKSSADSEVLAATRLLIGALQNAGVLGGTISVPAVPENGAPPVHLVLPESSDETTTTSG